MSVYQVSVRVWGLREGDKLRCRHSWMKQSVWEIQFLFILPSSLLKTDAWGLQAGEDMCLEWRSKQQ